MRLEPTLPPDLQPLRTSHEADAAETDLKQLTIQLFTNNLRDAERELNVYGMAHLGPLGLIERIVTGDGLALVRKDDQEAMTYLFKAWKSRNPKRGLIFLKTYLQLLWPNEWSLTQLWHRKDRPYPVGFVRPEDITDPDPTVNHYLTSRVAVEIASETEEGAGLLRVTPAMRSVIPARLLLLISIARYFVSTSEADRLYLANGATAVSMGFFTSQATLPS